MDRVVLVVGEPEIVFVVDEDAVRALEHALAPGVQKLAFLVEDDDRILAAVEHVDAVLRIARDAGDLDVGTSLGQLIPAFEHFEFDLVLPEGHGASSQ